MVKQLLLLLTVLSCGACSTIIDLDLPFEGAVIVANGTVSQVGVDVLLTRSADPNDTFFVADPGYVRGAQVVLSSSVGADVTVPESSPGRYVLSEALPAEATYALSIVAEGLPEATVPELTFPDYGGSATANLLNSNIDSSFFGTKFIDAELELVFTGRPEDFYLEFVTRFQFPDERTHLAEANPRLTLELEDACGISTFAGPGTIVPSTCFRSDTNRIRLEIDDRSLNEPERLLLEIAEVNESYYDHVRRLDQPEDGFALIYTEPNLYVSNVNGGFGYVSARRVSVLSWEL